jgi:hypothetical protein
MITFKKTTLYFLLLCGGFGYQVFGQEETVQVNQDPKIEQLVALKKEIDSEQYNRQYYAIQLYSGSSDVARKVVVEFSEKYSDISTSLVFETPNYKVRVGHFKDINKANMLLEEIKKTYPGAFLLEPNNL